MVDIKCGETYLTKYLGLQRTLKKGFQLITLIISVSGILGWKYFEDYVWIAFFLISIMQLVLLIENQLILSDKEIEKLSSLRMMYTRYFNMLEKLWTEFYYGKIEENTAFDKYFEFKESEWEKIEELDCQLNVKKYLKLMKVSEMETQN